MPPITRRRARSLRLLPEEVRLRQAHINAQLPLQVGRRVAYKAADGLYPDDDTWLLGQIIERIEGVSLQLDKYAVQDISGEEPDSQQPFIMTIQSFIPLPNANAHPQSLSHPSAYPRFPAATTVIAQYPDMLFFHPAAVLKTPEDNEREGYSRPVYTIQFESEDFFTKVEASRVF